MFTAYHRDDWLFSADGLDATLAFVLDCIDPTSPGDAVVWSGGRVAAVVRGDGTVIHLDGTSPAPPPLPSRDPAPPP
jgi:hypothetical protein